LKLDYELKIYNRQKNMLAPPELKEVHPLGKSPVISIDAPGLAKPLVLAESGLIVEYLLDHFGTHLIPKRWVDGKEGQVGGETEEWIRYRYYMHYAEGSLMIYLVVALLVGSKLDASSTMEHAKIAYRHPISRSPLLRPANCEWNSRED
jgi:glutathione S-transferase